jgi:hypothetical protein
MVVRLPERGGLYAAQPRYALPKQHAWTSLLLGLQEQMLTFFFNTSRHVAMFSSLQRTIQVPLFSVRLLEEFRTVFSL